MPDSRSKPDRGGCDAPDCEVCALATDLADERTLNQRLRASLERYGRHDSGCEAGAPFFPGRCVCGYHKALAQFVESPLSSDEQGASDA